jgi:hypothetical protein
VVNLVSDKANLCPGDTARICAASGYNSYNWNTGDTTPCVNATAAGNYFVSINQQGGCKAVSDTLNIVTYNVPPVTINVSGNTLAASGFAGYQWLLNGAAIPGATSATYNTDAGGTYKLQVTDSNGCTATSTPVIISGMANELPESIIIFPNPTLSAWQLNVSPGLIGSTIQAFNATGQLLLKSTITNQQSAITIPNAASGIYELRITSEVYSVVKRLVKM